MALRTVSVEAIKAPGIRKSDNGRVGLNLEALLGGSDKNFVVPLERGMLRTRSNVLFQEFKLEARITEVQRMHLMGALLESVGGWTRADYELTLSANNGEGGINETPSQVKVLPNGSKFAIVPVLPEILSRGRKGVTVEGVETREGIDNWLYETALNWSRNLNHYFGITRKKLDAPCVKSVCVDKREVEIQELNAIAYRSNATIDYRVRTSDKSFLELCYQDGVLGANGFTNAKWWSRDITYPVDKVMYRLGIVPDPTKKIVYDQHYYGEFQIGIEQLIKDLRQGVGGFFSAMTEEWSRAREERQQKLVERLKKTGVGMRENAGSICVVQYNPECLLEAPKPKPLEVSNGGEA